MIAARTSNRLEYWSDEGSPREIRLEARVEVPGEPDVDVDIQLRFRRHEPPAWDESIDQWLYDGVHAGLAAVEAPLPEHGIRVLITDLDFAPSLAAEPDRDALNSLGVIVQALAASTVKSLWAGLN
jgi:hypothetical protein